ncbi:MAG: DUF3641 domain-containing protein [Clostridia bacterium]|jgi:radical SAM/Cys-rich protein|nr:DUF3641 domain-containing protein [Clostridia bacterium]MDD4572300.1 DUF3641 domain-containing protein [Clostridia bacterium]
MEFYNKIAEAGLGTLTSRDIVKMQIDLAGTADDEMMSPEVVEDCLVALQDYHFTTLELRNKAPKQHPELLAIINKAATLDRRIILHINPEVLLLKEAENLLELLLEHKVALVINFPFVEADAETLKTSELYQKTILALKKLNAAGYGMEEDLELDLFYKPNSATLPAAQAKLEKQCRQELEKTWRIKFSKLLVAANSPVGCFAKTHLKGEEARNTYNALLQDAFNAERVNDLCCLNQIFVAADGSIYDCEYSADIALAIRADISNIRFYRHGLLCSRPIRVASHCFACTADKA